ncbi:ATP-grasp domain-containing protein [Cyclobacterium lianum]|nr:hypothetical protein [Cyclobacterium lianum]
MLELTISNHHYSIDLETDTFFYRRGGFNFVALNIPNVSSQFSVFITNELKTVKQFVERLFYNSSNVTTINSLNKLDVLKYAVEIGLKIPKSIITTKKEALRKFFYENNKKIIVKPLYEGLNIDVGNGFLKTYTSRIEVEDINTFENVFYPTFFQEEVEKVVEIRTFYLKTNFYSMAIFSQENEETKVDFRNYSLNGRLITTTFELPDLVKSKLIRIFEKLRIETGSVDLCLTSSSDFIFLEINPVGQYSMLYNCNYNLDREIAKII